ncbi:flagellar protein, partial [Calderihabitans maritimus]
SVKVYYSPQGG